MSRLPIVRFSYEDFTSGIVDAEWRAAIASGHEVQIYQGGKVVMCSSRRSSLEPETCPHCGKEIEP